MRLLRLEMFLLTLCMLYPLNEPTFFSVQRYKVDLVYDTNRWQYAEDKLSKNIIDPNLETPKYIATKSRETNVRDRALYHHANSHADQRENWAEMYHLCPRAKTARQRSATSLSKWTGMEEGPTRM